LAIPAPYKTGNIYKKKVKKYLKNPTLNKGLNPYQNFSRIRPKKICIDKERLFEDTIHL